MFVVVDANRVLSSLLTKGKVFDVFLINSSLGRLEFIAPEFLFFEVGKNLDEIVEKSKLSKEDLAKIFSFIKKEVEFIPFREFNKFANKGLELAPHEKDVQYFALALAFNCGIWSDERGFRKQSEVRIFSNNDLFKLLAL